MNHPHKEREINAIAPFDLSWIKPGTCFVMQWPLEDYAAAKILLDCLYEYKKQLTPLVDANDTNGCD